jgi:hypothetical protein
MTSIIEVVKSIQVLDTSKFNENLPISSDYANWIVPGRIMCGPYPCADGINFNQESGLSNINKLLADGIDTFVCLCSELPDTTKTFNGQINHPYFPQYIHYTNIIKTVKPECNFIYIPINDGNVGSISDTLQGLTAILKMYISGSNIYIHCAGGHGRTNIFTSILASIIYKIEPETALDFVFHMRNKRRIRDKKLEIYNIPQPDRHVIFRTSQESMVKKICHYIQVSQALL